MLAHADGFVFEDLVHGQRTQCAQLAVTYRATARQCCFDCCVVVATILVLTELTDEFRFTIDNLCGFKCNRIRDRASQQTFFVELFNNADNFSQRCCVIDTTVTDTNSGRDIVVFCRILSLEAALTKPERLRVAGIDEIGVDSAFRAQTVVFIAIGQIDSLRCTVGIQYRIAVFIENLLLGSGTELDRVCKPCQCVTP